MNGFTFFQNYFNSIDNPDNGLTMEEKGELYTAIFAYMFNDVLPTDLKGACNLAFHLIKPSLDKSKQNGKNKIKNEAESENIPSEMERNGNEMELNGNEMERNGNEWNEMENEIPPFLKKKEEEKERERERENNNPPYNPPTEEKMEGKEGEILVYQEVLTALQEDCPVIYERHERKTNGGRFDCATKVISLLDEIGTRYTLDELRAIFRKANKSFAVLPKYESCDFVWMLNNLERIKASQDEPYARGSPEVVGNDGLTDEQRKRREKFRGTYGE